MAAGSHSGFGYFTALRIGFGGMAVALVLGLILPGIAGQILALVAWTVPLCLIWPTLEALVTEGETFQGTARMVGIYNLVWSATSAVAFCAGGWLWEKLGRNGLYGLPLAPDCAGIRPGALAGTSGPENARPAKAPFTPRKRPTNRRPPPRISPCPPKRFLQMAWLANPFAYVAINTVGAVIPQLAHKFELTANAGRGVQLALVLRAVCLVHRPLEMDPMALSLPLAFAAFIGLIAGFSTLLLAPQLWLVRRGTNRLRRRRRADLLLLAVLFDGCRRRQGRARRLARGGHWAGRVRGPRAGGDGPDAPPAKRRRRHLGRDGLARLRFCGPHLVAVQEIRECQAVRAPPLLQKT